MRRPRPRKAGAPLLAALQRETGLQLAKLVGDAKVAASLYLLRNTSAAHAPGAFHGTPIAAL